MAVTVIGLKELRRALNELEVSLGSGARGRRQLMLRLGRAFRDASRQNITRQSGNGKPYPKLSDWTFAKTGRRKALLSLRKEIDFSFSADGAVIYFTQRSPKWNLTMHHKGYTSKAVSGKRMAIPIKFPTVSRFGRTRVIFNPNRSPLIIHKRKASVVPARPVWPEGKRAHEIVLSGIRDFMALLARRVR